MSFTQKKQRPDIVIRAKTLRKQMSLPEVLLWELLRPKVNKEFNLRRQTPLLDCYVVDFYYELKQIAFEVDGRTFHEDRVEYDYERDQLLAQNGISVVRIGAHRVLKDRMAVAAFIRSICLGEVELEDLEPNSVTIANGRS